MHTVSTISSSTPRDAVQISPQDEGAHLKQSLWVIRFFLLIIVLSCVNTRYKGISGSPADDNNHRAPARGTNTMGMKQKRKKKKWRELLLNVSAKQYAQAGVTGFRISESFFYFILLLFPLLFHFGLTSAPLPPPPRIRYYGGEKGVAHLHKHNAHPICLIRVRSQCWMYVQHTH